MGDIWWIPISLVNIMYFSNVSRQPVPVGDHWSVVSNLLVPNIFFFRQTMANQKIFVHVSFVHTYSGNPDSVVGLFIWGSLSGGDS